MSVRKVERFEVSVGTTRDALREALINDVPADAEIVEAEIEKSDLPHVYGDRLRIVFERRI